MVFRWVLKASEVSGIVLMKLESKPVMMATRMSRRPPSGSHSEGESSLVVP